MGVCATGWLALGCLNAQAQRPELRLNLRTDGANTILTYIYFKEGATTGLNPDFDAIKPPNIRA